MVQTKNMDMHLRDITQEFAVYSYLISMQMSGFQTSTGYGRPYIGVRTSQHWELRIVHDTNDHTKMHSNQFRKLI